MGDQAQAVATPDAEPSPAGAPAGAEPKRSAAKLLIGWGERYALVVALIGLIVLFSVLPATADTFLTTVNIRNVLATQAVVSIAAIAVLIPLICAQFDISIGALLGLAAYLCGSALQNGFPLLLAMLAIVALAALFGVVNGWLVAYVRANSIIITLGMSTLITGFVSLYSKDATLVGVPDAMADFGAGVTLGIPNATWVLVVVAVVVWYLLRFTVFGRQLLMIGSSERAAELVGVRTKRLVFMAFVLAGTIAGIAGVLALARAGSASPVTGPGYTLPAVAAVFLGSTTIRPGQFNVPGTIVGVFFVAVSVNGLTLAGTASWVDPVFNGAAVVIAVAASTLLLNRRAGRGRSGAV